MNDFKTSKTPVAALTDASKIPTSLAKLTDVQARQFATRYMGFLEHEEPLYTFTLKQRGRHLTHPLLELGVVLSLILSVLLSPFVPKGALAVFSMVLVFSQMGFFFLVQGKFPSSAAIAALGAGEVLKPMLVSFERTRSNAGQQWDEMASDEQIERLADELTTDAIARR